MKHGLKPFAALMIVIALAFPCRAAAAKPAPPFIADLSPQAIRHGVECPLPAKGPCVIRKPVGKSYRQLTLGVSLEDMGDYWLADFSKAKDPKSDRQSLRILGGNGELHEIEVQFPRPAAVKEKPAAKPPADGKEAPREAEAAK